jgi:hypothetical protein
MEDGLNRDDQATVTPQSYQSSFNAVQASAADPNALSNTQKRKDRAWNVLRKHSLDILDLFVGDRNTEAASSDETNYTVCL